MPVSQVFVAFFYANYGYVFSTCIISYYTGLRYSIPV